MQPGPLTITTLLAREPLPVTGERQVAYVLVDVRATDGERADLPVNLGFVLDHSGSMRGPRLQQLKVALADLIDQLGDADRIAVVLFDDRVDLLVPSQPVSDPAQLKAEIEQIVPGGGTALALGLSLGLVEARKGDGPGVASSLLLVTDGDTRGDGDYCLDLAGQAGEAGIPIVPSGMGAEWNDAFLDILADRSGGSPSAYIRTPGAISAHFSRHLQSQRRLAARRLQLVAQFVAGVEPRHVTRVAPLVRPIDDVISGDHLTIALGDLDRDTPQQLLIELLIEPKKGGTFRIAQLEGTALAPDGSTQTTRMDVVVTFSSSATKQPQTRPAVVQAVGRANAARLVLRALDAPQEERPIIAPTVVTQFEGDSREALEHLRAGAVLSPEERKSLLAGVRELGTGRKPQPA